MQQDGMDSAATTMEAANTSAEEVLLATSANVSKRVVIGTAFMVAMRFVFRGIGLVNTLILVRFLTPADFGLVGFATMAFSVLDQISDLSSGTVLIRMKSPERRHYDTAWTLGILRGLLTGALFAISAPVLAWFIHEPRVELLSYVIAASAVMGSLSNPGMIDLQRDLRFDRVFWVGVTTKVLGTATCIAIAVIFRSYWALLAGLVVSGLVGMLLSYLVSSYRPRFNLSAWRELLGFSKWMMVINVQNMIDSYSTVFTVGRINGPAAIGLYQVAYQIAALPVSEVAAPARGPIYAGYAQVSHDRALLRRHFIDGFGLIFLLVTPACVGIALLAGPVTHIFLGAKWLAATSVVALCCFYALFDSVAHFCQPLFFVLHRERQFVHIFTAVLAVRLPSMLLGAYYYGVEGAVTAMMITAFLNLVLWMSWVTPLIELRFNHLVHVIWRTLVGTGVMSAVVWYAAARWPVPTATIGLLRFLCLCGLGAVVHFAVQLSLWAACGYPNGAETSILRTGRSLLMRVPLLGPRLASRTLAWKVAR